MICKSRIPHWNVFLGLSMVSIICVCDLTAQDSVVTYPTAPSAAAGMTSGMPNGLSAQQIEMMRVRTEAQSAQGNAVAASMARSVDETLENQSRERTLESAREIKAIKRSMQERLKWERANNQTQVNKVSNADMSAWNTTNGNVRVERNVPDPFLSSLIEEERRNMERGVSEQPKKGFNPLKSAGAVLTSPFQRMAEPSASTFVEPTAASSSSSLPAAESSGGGFFSKIKVPMIGGKKDNEPVNPGNAEPQFVASSAASAPPQSQPAVVTTPGVVPRISGAELVDGSSPVNQTADSSPAASSSNSAPVFAAAPTSLPDESSDKPGFFSKFKSDSSTPGNSGGGGFFGFGKKKAPAGPAIDASLFPAGSVAQAPTGGSLGGGYTADDVVEESMAVPSSTGSIDLPGESVEKKRPGFSIPKPSLASISKPNLSIPGMSQGGGSSAASVPTLTTVNSSGNSYYVVTDTAQFMVYGEDQLQSEVRALSAGTVVQMTKPGEQWASIQVPGGASGIVQNKFLRAASAGEVGGQFAASN
ncbi:MAG: hypothetical protein P1U68_11930 [Verrucomicrobiales bacterium]|nr:hypothetical protein [Verrucomicrobiales bacterium]